MQAKKNPYEVEKVLLNNSHKPCTIESCHPLVLTAVHKLNLIHVLLSLLLFSSALFFALVRSISGSILLIHTYDIIGSYANRDLISSSHNCGSPSYLSTGSGSSLCSTCLNADTHFSPQLKVFNRFSVEGASK